ncbi:MAG TPA: hypothetical protein DCS09_07030 [Porphyromonadaceae bacterium]|nr:hypothetical protein [Porphyromonadaceae bacterium]
MSHYLGKPIVTHPHEDEHGNREWKTDECDKACIKGYKETHSADVCEFYVQKLTAAFCCYEETA